MSGTLAIHERIRRDLESQIISGALSAGDRIPIEHELMAEYGCSRMTVNKAVIALVATGLIERRKRAGSFVARPKGHRMQIEIPDLEAQVTARGELYRFQWLSRDIWRPDGGGSALLTIDGLHMSNGIAFAFEHRLIALDAVPHAETLGPSSGSPGAWLLAHVPWTEAETRFDALNADRDLATHLGLRVGDACLQVERKTWRGNDRITLVRQIFAPGAQDLVARFGHQHA